MKKILYLWLCVSLMVGVLPAAAWADPEAEAQAPCTSSAIYDFTLDGSGIISDVVVRVQSLVDDTSETLFKSITQNASFKRAFSGALTLFVVFYGAAALMGVVQISLGDGAVRLLKFGFVVLMVTNWSFFSATVMKFFTVGTNDLINKMTAVAIGQPVGTGAGPLKVLDSVISVGFGVKMVITLLALFFDVSGWPWGPVFGVLVLWGMFTAFRAVFSAVWIFLMSLIAKALLFGLAPVFITCVLFQRTRHLFEGWVSQLISYSLQPILLFAFLGFYMVLIDASLKEILNTEICFYPIKTQFFEALPNVGNWWQFKREDTDVGYWGVETGYPISIVNVLIFILLAQLAYRHTQIIQVLAREISGSIVSLSDLRPGVGNAISSMEEHAKHAAQAGVVGHPAGAGTRGVAGTAGAHEGIRS